MKRVYLKLSEITGHHGICDQCRLFGRIHIDLEHMEHLCDECYTIKYEEKLEQETQKVHKEIRNKRLSIIVEKNIQHRIKKGWCPIKLRS